MVGIDKIGLLEVDLLVEVEVLDIILFDVAVLKEDVVIMVAVDKSLDSKRDSVTNEEDTETTF